MIASFLTALLLTTAPDPTGDAAVRTLDAINIEGEIDLPQVLFITSRDQERHDDRLHRIYLKSCADIGRELAWPTRVTPVGKEN